MNSDIPPFSDPTEDGGNGSSTEWRLEKTEVDVEAGAEVEGSELARIFDAFLLRVRAGESPDPQQLLDEHPTLADKLRVCLDVLYLSDHLAASPGSADSGLGTPKRLGEFRIIRPLGRGGMGVVYEAEQASLGRRVALKVLPIVSALDPKHLQRFQIEAKAAAQLQHPHIVPVYAIGSDRGVHYYAMQLIEGKTLAQWISASRQERKVNSSPKEGSEFFQFAAKLGLQAAEALEHSHSRGVLHRDIKPANLLLDPAENLWVSDFGLARLKDSGDLTRTQETPGTIRYMSPERVLGPGGDVDERTDIYSLGATLYELLILRPAYDGQDTQELLRQIAQDEPIPMRRLNPSMPLDLETIVHKAMARNSGERYESAGALAGDLRRFLNGEPIAARRPTPFKKLERWATRHRVGVMLGVPLVVLAVIVSTLLIQNRRRARIEAEQRRVSQYEEDVRQASHFLQRYDLPRASALLERYRSAPDASDLRTFAWYLLWDRCHPRASLRILDGHQGEAFHVAFSPNGRLLASCGHDGMVHFWEPAAGLDLRTVKAHVGDVNDLCFSPDGKTLATAGDDGFIRFWDTETEALKGTLEKQSEWVVAVVFASDGKRLVSGRRDGLIQVWDLSTGKVEQSFRQDVKNLEGIALSPDGNTVVTSSRSEVATAWDVKSGKIKFYLNPKGGPQAPNGNLRYVRKLPFDNDEPLAARSSAFSHDGKVIATAGADGVVRLWDAKSGDLKAELRGHSNDVQSVAFTSDDRRIASSGSDGSIRLWDATDGTALNDFQGEAWKIWSVAFSPNDRLLASANYDGKIQIWDPAIPSHRLSLKKPPAGTILMGFSYQGDVLTLNRWDGALTAWSRVSGQPLKTGYVPSLGNQAFPATTPDGRTLAVMDVKRSVTLWSIEDVVPRPVTRLPDDKQSEIFRQSFPSVLGISRDAKIIALAQPGQQIFLWYSQTNRLRRSPPMEAGLVIFTDDGRSVIATENTRPIRWDLETDEIQRSQQPGHRPVPAPINSLVLSPNGRIIATGGFDQIIKLWDAETLELRADLVGHTGNICSLAFSPDGKILASGGGDHLVKLWSVDSGRELVTLEGHSENVCSVWFSSRGDLLVSRCINSSDRPEEIFLWSASRERSKVDEVVAKTTPQP